MVSVLGQLDWVQVDLLVRHRITSIVTLGSAVDSYRCTLASISSSDDMITWTDSMDEDGNVLVSNQADESPAYGCGRHHITAD